MVVTQIFIDIGCSYFSGGNGTDDGSRTGHTVTTGKYTVDILDFTVTHAVMVPRFTEIPASSKWRVSIP